MKMKKIPYCLISIFLGANVLCRYWLPHWMILIAIFFYLATGIVYIAGTIKHHTSFFHTYIGWTWMILAIVFAHAYWTNPFSEWNTSILFIFGLCISLCMLGFWRKGEQISSDKISFFQVCATILLAMAIAFFPMGINESIVTEYEFQNVTISSKDVFVTDTSLFVSNAYLVTLEQPGGKLDGLSGGISENYWNRLQVGEKVPVCAYTGLLGKKFYSFFKDDEKSEDYYGLHAWTVAKFNETQNK